MNTRRLDAFGEKPHLAADQPLISHHFMDSAESVVLATDVTFSFFLSFIFSQILIVLIRAELGCCSLLSAAGFGM